MQRPKSSQQLSTARGRSLKSQHDRNSNDCFCSFVCVVLRKKKESTAVNCYNGQQVVLQRIRSPYRQQARVCLKCWFSVSMIPR